MVHSQVDKADEAQLLTMLSVVKEVADRSSLPDDGAFIAELERRWEGYLKGEEEPLTMEECEQKARAILNRTK
jgi:hypothetical protein